MPLVHGSSEDAISENIRREREAGKPEEQAVAIAENEARENKEVIAPGHELMEKLMTHHKSMLDGVDSYLPAIEHEHKMNAFKTFSHMSHKAMTELADQTGYPVKMCEYPETLKPVETKDVEDENLPKRRGRQEENFEQKKKPRCSWRKFCWRKLAKP